MSLKWMLLGLLAVAASAMRRTQRQDETQQVQRSSPRCSSATARSRCPGAGRASASARSSAIWKPPTRARCWSSCGAIRPTTTCSAWSCRAAHGLPEDGSWAVVVTLFRRWLRVRSEAAGIDYDEVLADMKDGPTKRTKRARKPATQTVQLNGWAAAAALRRRQQEAVLGEGPAVRRRAHAHAELRHPRARPQRLPQPQRGRRHGELGEVAGGHAEAAADGRVRSRRALRRLQRQHRQGRRLRPRRAGRRRPRGEGGPVRQARRAVARPEEAADPLVLVLAACSKKILGLFGRKKDTGTVS